MKTNLFSKYAIYVGLSLFAYFLLMDLIGLANHVELRFFNGVILALGLWGALSAASRTGKHFGLPYLTGIKTGIRLSTGASLMFVLLFLAYNAITGNAFLQDLYIQQVIPEYVSIWQLSILLFAEGLASGFIISFIMMQYLKYDRKVLRELGLS